MSKSQLIARLQSDTSVAVLADIAETLWVTQAGDEAAQPHIQPL
jgi:hypothetical protein